MRRVKRQNPLEGLEIGDSFELLCALKNIGYLNDNYQGERELWWTPSDCFATIIEAILVQNSRYEKVKIAMQNLGCFVESPEDFVLLDVDSLAERISPVGFYHTKAKRLSMLCRSILDDFGDFESMKQDCSREWLLQQKGIGFETADAILCYAFGRDVMVADRYSFLVLQSLGYEMQNYEEIQEWLQRGIFCRFSEVLDFYGKENLSKRWVFARFHGKIDEFAKEYQL